MDFNSVISFMGHQAKALKDLENLLAHDEKQDVPGHSVLPENIETLKTYVSTMKIAVDTATALAKYYKVTGTGQPAGEVEKPPKKRTTKKPDPPIEEPAKEPEPEEEFDFLS